MLALLCFEFLQRFSVYGGKGAVNFIQRNLGYFPLSENVRDRVDYRPRTIRWSKVVGVSLRLYGTPEFTRHSHENIIKFLMVSEVAGDNGPEHLLVPLEKSSKLRGKIARHRTELVGIHTPMAPGFPSGMFFILVTSIETVAFGGGLKRRMF